MQGSNELSLSEKPKSTIERDLIWIGAILSLMVVVVATSRFILPVGVYAQVQTFVTIFLGIFVEAAPFLLAGSIVSGLLDIFVDQKFITRVAPRNPVLGAFMGSLLGFAFPVCECGVVPVTRRLYQKGLPHSIGISFLLSAPVVNPVVVASTYAAFGAGVVLTGRFLITITVAFIVGLIFTFAKPEDILLPKEEWSHGHDHDHDQHAHDHDHDHSHNAPHLGFREKMWASLTVAGNDFIDMSRYLIVGSMMAALMQTIVPQATLLSLGAGAVLSVVTLMVLAFVLSVCSTVDAFIALSFTNTFTTGSILSFLTFGPMVDVKSSLMFLGVFKRRVVVYLIVLPLLLNMIFGLMINFYTSW